MSTSNYRGRVPGSVNKSHKQPHSRLPGLTSDEESRLRQYQEAVRKIRFGSENSRGTISDYLRLAIRSKAHNSLRTSIIQTIQEDDVLHEQLETLISERRAEENLSTKLEKEIKELMELPLFQQYTPAALDEIKEIKDGHFYDDIKKAAPMLYALLLKICRNSDKTDEGKNQARIVSIFSTICFTKHPRLCNYLPALMSLLLYSTGVKRHVFSLTNSLGFTESYNTTLETINGLQEKALEHLRQRVEKGNWAFVFDNCELYVGTSEQGGEKKATVESITVGLVIEGPELRQDQFNPKFLLHPDEITHRDDRDKGMEQVTRAIVCEALSKGFGYLSERIKNSQSLRHMAKWPAIDILPPPHHATRHPIPLMPIMISEDTTANNIRIVENIREQLDLSDEFFEQTPPPVILVGGDQKTVSRLFSAKSSAGDCISAYDQLQWMKPIPGLFHAQMHTLEAIIKIHWGAEATDTRGVDHCSLRYAAGKMARHFVSPKKQVYSHARTFVKDNLYGRILAEFINHLSDMQEYHNQLPPYATAEDVRTIVEQQLSTQKLGKLIQQTATSIKDLDSCDGIDNERHANLLFIRDAELYLLLSRGIKYGDIGLIRWAVDYLILVFHGIKKPLYAKLFLYLKHLIDSDHTTPEARQLIASALLVNPSGTHDGFYPIDLANEFHNRDIKEVWSDRHSSSTSSVQKLATFCTLNTIFIKTVRHVFHHLWGKNTAGKHTEAARGKLLENIARCFRITMKPNTLRTRKLKWSQDVLVTGRKKIASSALWDYNAKFLLDSTNSEETVQVIWEEDVQPEEDTGNNIVEVDNDIINA